jgi:hypothetical protein
VLDEKTKTHMVNELVRINHMRNCYLCHAASQAPSPLEVSIAGKTPAGLKKQIAYEEPCRGLVPRAGRALPVAYCTKCVCLDPSFRRREELTTGFGDFVVGKLAPSFFIRNCNTRVNRPAGEFGLLRRFPWRLSGPAGNCPALIGSALWRCRSSSLSGAEHVSEESHHAEEDGCDDPGHQGAEDSCGQGPCEFGA